jgi:hypothetical protein
MYLQGRTNNLLFGDGPNSCLRRAALNFLKCTALHILLIFKTPQNLMYVWRLCSYLNNILNFNGSRNPPCEVPQLVFS